MTIRYISGLDWSGDPGDVANAVRASPFLVVGMCHIHISDREVFATATQHLRQEFRLPERHAFKFARSSDRLRQRYLEVLINADLSFTVAAFDRRRWSSEYIQRTTGSQRMLDAICSATESLANDLVCGQRLLIDANKWDARFISALRVATSRKQRVLGRPSFAKIAPLPDDREDALIIQAADFIAGYVGRILMSEVKMDDRLDEKITLVQF